MEETHEVAIKARSLFLFLALALLVVSCAAEDTTVDEPAATTSQLPTGSAPAGTTVITEPPVTGETVTTVEPTTTSTVPIGTVIDFGPKNGDVLAVIGVAHDDTLNLRAGPGTSQTAIDVISPTYEDLIALGETRELGRSLWLEVDYEGTTGWVHMSFVGALSRSEDATATVSAHLGEDHVSPTMSALGLLAAETFASADPPSRIVMTVGPDNGHPEAATYDVIGLGDDAILGVRVRVLGEPIGDGFGIESVETTNLCGRDVTPDGYCV